MFIMKNLKNLNVVQLSAPIKVWPQSAPFIGGKHPECAQFIFHVCKNYNQQRQADRDEQMSSNNSNKS